MQFTGLYEFHTKGFPIAANLGFSILHEPFFAFPSILSVYLSHIHISKADNYFLTA